MPMPATRDPAGTALADQPPMPATTEVPDPSRERPNPLVLLVSDDEPAARTLTATLEHEYFSVVHTRDAGTAVALCRCQCTDLVLLAPGPRDTTVTRLCAELGASSRVPIIAVTPPGACADSLEAGADTTLATPYSSVELIARAHALLRRSASTSAPQASVGNNVLQAGGVRIDQAAHQVQVDGHTVDLTLKEFQLLEVMVTAAGRLLTRDELLQQVWSHAYTTISKSPKTLDVHIKRLRTKIEPYPHRPTRIQTVRGLGYRFTEPARA